MSKNISFVVNGSHKGMLSRIYKSCKNTTSDDKIIDCMLNNVHKQKYCNPNITYYNPDYAGISEGVSTWQGICKSNNGILICGTTQPGPNTGLGLLYFGNIMGDTAGQTSTTFLVPGSEYTSCYGPRYDSTTTEFTLVGSYSNPSDTNLYGFLFRGMIDQLGNSSNYICKMQPLPNTQYPITFVHSTYGNFAVGASSFELYITDQSWIYNIETTSYTIYKYQNAKYTTIYGIVMNSNGTYTIVGGYSNGISLGGKNISKGFIVDMIYDSNGLTFLNETTITVDNDNNILTHFQGISITNNSNVYTVASDGISIKNLKIGGSMIIQRDTTNSCFKVVKSTIINYGCLINDTSGIVTSNSVLGNNVVGLYVSTTEKMSFQCNIDWNAIN